MTYFGMGDLGLEGEGWSETGFFSRTFRHSPQKPEKPGFFSFDASWTPNILKVNLLISRRYEEYVNNCMIWAIVWQCIFPGGEDED